MTSNSRLRLLLFRGLALGLMNTETINTEVLIIGAGPAGASAAFHAASAGWDVMVVDMFDMLASPRDKTCGDGLTPRAVGALEAMGAGHLLDGHPEIRGLKLHGFGGSITAPWPAHSRFPQRGSAIPRSDFDSRLLGFAVDAGARFIGGMKAVDVSSCGRRVICRPNIKDANQPNLEIHTRFLILAEGVRSMIARKLGVQWLRGLVHGIAARSYVESARADEPWIHSHVELRDSDGVAQPGYGWVFPLGAPTAGGLAGGGPAGDGVGAGGAASTPTPTDNTTTAQPHTDNSLLTPAPAPVGQVNLGCGALATSERPAKVNTKKLLVEYANLVRDDWGLGEPQRITSALLPMGGAVTRVAGRNWAAIGDTAALVNPLNGEGIDYGIESARLVVDLLSDAARNPDGLTHMWPARLREEYGDAFALARRLGMLLTMPGLMAAIGPVGMSGPLASTVMNSAARLMGNLVTPEDKDLTARLWLGAGKLSRGVDRLFAADSRPLFGATMR